LALVVLYFTLLVCLCGHCMLSTTQGGPWITSQRGNAGHSIRLRTLCCNMAYGAIGCRFRRADPWARGAYPLRLCELHGRICRCSCECPGVFIPDICPSPCSCKRSRIL